MANAGKNTNKSQFFITFRECRHLDYKHTIFGRYFNFHPLGFTRCSVVGGKDTLNVVEARETHKEDRPKIPVIIQSVEVHANPFAEYEEIQAKGPPVEVDILGSLS